MDTITQLSTLPTATEIEEFPDAFDADAERAKLNTATARNASDDQAATLIVDILFLLTYSDEPCKYTETMLHSFSVAKLTYIYEQLEKEIYG